jgi:hypothetical protein
MRSYNRHCLGLPAKRKSIESRRGPNTARDRVRDSRERNLDIAKARTR